MTMGDIRECSLPSGGVLMRGNHFCSCSGSGVCLVNSDPALIPEENWMRAEEAAREILYTIHPTVEADYRRKEVTEYVRGLIKSSLGFEVFPYGSVPLKTYLPDGDIDLTAISSPPVEDTIFTDVHAVLKQEEINRDALYEVKDVHFIYAEVKLVKCIVQNMVVDISFNQLGGLSTLCFLEQVDRLVGKDHLFKRSIILIKSWCYYESRILGAHHGLLSTYALETLILYIFNLFHSSLDGPLAVLHKFLDYYSKFDFDNYCISLNGPVCKTSLPNIVVRPFEIGRGKLLLKDEFLRRCIDMFSVPSKNPELNSWPFPQKHLNIVDPLKANNNLGRSVSRGNFYRIRSAIRYGARKLGQILLLPSERMSYELNKFFGNTLDRHRSNYWTHVEDSRVLSCPRNSDNSSSSSSSSSFSCSSSEDDKSTLNGKASPNGASDGEISCALRSECEENHIMINNLSCSCSNNHEGKNSAHVNKLSDDSTPSSLEEMESARNSNSSKSLMDLSGDYESQFRSLLCGQHSHFYASSSNMLSYHPMLTELAIKNPWQTIRESLQLKRNFHPRRKANGILGCNPTLNHTVPFSEAFSHDEKKERRGTGTYIPNMLYYTDEDRPSPGRGKNHASRVYLDLHRNDRDKGCSSTSENLNSSENNYDLSEAEYPYLGNGKPASSEVRLLQSSPWVFCIGNGNGISRAPHITDLGCQSIQLPEGSHPDRLTGQDVASSPTETAEQKPEHILENDSERVEGYHLKDEVDFPPLSH